MADVLSQDGILDETDSGLTSTRLKLVCLICCERAFAHPKAHGLPRDHHYQAARTHITRRRFAHLGDGIGIIKRWPELALEVGKQTGMRHLSEGGA